MEIHINEIINWFYNNYKDQLVKVHIIKAKNLSECFKRVYALRRSGRYDSSRRYEFDGHDLENQYKDWEKENETIDMYYGNGAVD